MFVKKKRKATNFLKIMGRRLETEQEGENRNREKTYATETHQENPDKSTPDPFSLSVTGLPKKGNEEKKKKKKKKKSGKMQVPGQTMQRSLQERGKLRPFSVCENALSFKRIKRPKKKSRKQSQDQKRTKKAKKKLDNFGNKAWTSIKKTGSAWERGKTRKGKRREK